MLNPMQLVDRTILITGASSGIGRDTAILLSQLGARVLLVGRNDEQLKKTHDMLEGTGHRFHAYDLTAVDDIPLWMKGIIRETGPLHGLVHCAGMQFTRPLRITTGASMEELMRINVTSALCLAKAFRQKGVCVMNSSIVIVTSVMGVVGQPGQAAYSASKGALVTLTKSLALELCGEGIRVNCVAPGVVKTEMTDKMLKSLTHDQIAQVEAMHPLGIGTPRDVANAIAFLLADTGRWITGSTLLVDGGYTAH
jgi:NAD(P)-dependent dehydrogenase (short-subunit alcohol dehydrogenase family)